MSRHSVPSILFADYNSGEKILLVRSKSRISFSSAIRSFFFFLSFVSDFLPRNLSHNIFHCIFETCCHQILSISHHISRPLSPFKDFGDYVFRFILLFSLLFFFFFSFRKIRFKVVFYHMEKLKLTVYTYI